MTVKVKSQPEREITCGGCKSILEYEMQDLVLVYVDRERGSQGAAGAAVQCPVCRDTTQVKTAPQSLINLLLTKAQL